MSRSSHQGAPNLFSPHQGARLLCAVSAVCALGMVTGTASALDEPRVRTPSSATSHPPTATAPTAAREPAPGLRPGLRQGAAPAARKSQPPASAGVPAPGSRVPLIGICSLLIGFVVVFALSGRGAGVRRWAGLTRTQVPLRAHLSRRST